MDLNNHTSFPHIDKQNYLAEIENLPSQLENAYQQGLSLNLPAWQGIQDVLIAGMGGSAIGADLLAAYAAPLCPVPIVVQRDYSLPAWAHGPGDTGDRQLAFGQHRGNPGGFRAGSNQQAAVSWRCARGENWLHRQ